MHSSLLQRMVVERLCMSEFNKTLCHHKNVSDTMLASHKISKGTDQWLRSFNISSSAVSIGTILVLSVVAALLRRKEFVGIYIAIVLTTQSLVYLVLAALESTKIKHLFAGVLLNPFIGNKEGALVFVWIFLAAATDSNLTRSFAFICVAGMVHMGKAVGYFAARYLPQLVPSLSYLFAGTFTLSLVTYMMASYILPTFQEIIVWKNGFIKKQDYLDSTRLFSSLLYVSNNIKREYLAGIILTAFLTQLSNSFFSSVILQYFLEPPLHFSYESSVHYLWSVTAIKGISCILTAFILIKILYASDTTMVLLSLSCSAFWMVLIAYTSTETMLYILTVCLAGFVPIGISLLHCIASKECDSLIGYFALLVGLIGSFSLLCQTLVAYNLHVFIDADRKIFHSFTLIFAGALQLMAFIVLTSISCAFRKPLIEVPEEVEILKERTKQEPKESSTETESLLDH